MSRGAFNTTLVWHDSTGGEIEAKVRVVYSYHAGYPDTMEEPGCDGSAEIISITPTDTGIVIPPHFYESEELLAECLADHADDMENAREWHAQCRRDDLLMERF